MSNANSYTRDFPLGRLTRFDVGGKAKYFQRFRSELPLITAVAALHNAGKKFIIIGAGTNLLVPDDGVRQYVIQNKIGGIVEHGQVLVVGSGVNLNYLVNYCNRRGLAGMEKMAGIPGDLGGAIVGNAGAYGQEISNVVRRVKIYDGKRVRWLTRRQCHFQYRHSVFKERRDWIVLAVELRLVGGRAPAALARTSTQIRRLRNRKYPPGLKCPGSYFQNILLAKLPVTIRKKLATQFPEKINHGKLPTAVLLEAVGLKGLRRGNIQIADYHANLIISLGHGRARDVLAIAALAKKMVYHRFGVQLEAEVRVLDN